MIMTHQSGFIEVHIDNMLLLLTKEEFEKMRRRGESVERNRRIAGKTDTPHREAVNVHH